MGQQNALPFSTILDFLLGESVLCDWKCIKWMWSCRFKCLEWRLLCKTFLYLPVVLKYDQCYSTGSGCNEFSCVSSEKIRDMLCKECTGNFFFLASCTGRHRESKIVALSSWLLMQGTTLLLVGTFAIALNVSRTAFICHSFCCVYLLLPFHCCLVLTSSACASLPACTGGLDLH